jgi:hypothetical protein
VSLNFSLHRLFSSIRVINLHLQRVHIPAFLLKDLLNLSVTYGFEVTLALTCLNLGLKFVDLLQQGKSLVFFLTKGTLEISSVLLLVHRHCLEGLELLHNLVSLL